MKAALYLLCIALGMLAGCALPIKHEMASKPARVSFDVVGSLAVGDCDLQTAADYTAVYTARRSATTLLVAGEMSAQQAQQVQDAADKARAALDRACKRGVIDPADLAEARTARAELNAVMKEAHHAR